MSDGLPRIVRPEDRRHLTILVYGPTGAGKSWFAASSEALPGRTLVLMTEDASVGLKGFDVDIVEVHSSSEMWAVMRALKAGTSPFDRYRDGVVVVDSLTQAQAFFLAADAEEEFRKQHTKTPLQIPRDSYMRVTEDIRRLVWFARTLPMHQVYICLDRLFTTEEGAIQLRGPDLTPVLSGDVRAYADVVAYLVAENRAVKTPDGKTERRLVRRLFLQPGDGFYARVRAGKDLQVPEYIVNPTMPKLLQTLGMIQKKEAEK